MSIGFIEPEWRTDLTYEETIELDLPGKFRLATQIEFDESSPGELDD